MNMATRLPAKIPQKHSRKDRLWRKPMLNKSRSVKLKPPALVVVNDGSVISISCGLLRNPGKRVVLVRRHRLVDLPVRSQPGIGNKGLDLGKRVLGHDHHIPGMKGGILMQVAPLFHVLDVENLCRKPLVVDAAEQ